MQVLICAGIMLVFGIVMFGLYLYNKSKHVAERVDDVYTHQEVVNLVINRLADYAKETNFDAKDDAEFEALYKRHERVENALVNCVLCIEKDMIIVIELIVGILKGIFPTREALYKVYNYDSYALEPSWQWEVLIERLSSEHKKNSVPYVIDKYSWDRVRYEIEDGTIPSFFVDEKDLQQVYDNEVIEPLNFREALRVTATIIYREIKGLGVIHTLRMQNVDGVNVGAYGAIMTSNPGKEATRSVGVYYHGKYIHFRFLNFGTMEEMRRVVQLAIRYNNPGPLTEKRGYIVTTMCDQSRILAIRPGAGECWACFIRKFVLSNRTLEALIDPPLKDKLTGTVLVDEDGNERHLYTNAQLPLNTVKLLMQGQVTSGFTGRQGSGKTTMMVAAISQVDARYTIRVLEMAPEMYLREVYPCRNIYSVAETPTITAAELQDALKKSDAALSIVGEVATDIVAARMLQMGQVASIFTIFSHHANRARDLVNALTNSVVAASGGTATPETVMPQVLDVVKVDVHLDYDVSGNRYIERITELIKLDSLPYPDQLPGESLEEYKVKIMKEYYTRVTDRSPFTWRDVVVFNNRTYTYDIARDEKGNPQFFSDVLTRRIFANIPPDRVDYWKNWVKENWKAA